MNATDAYLMKFLGQNNVCFEIPVYQRNYDWKIEHCRQLLEDISNSVDKNLNSYFIGSIVHIQDKGPISVAGLNNVVIIDGQQRLTTISLMLLALANTGTNEQETKPIMNNYLLNPLQEDAGKVKLKPVKGDRNVFVDLIRGKEPSATDTVNNVVRNYRFIRDSIKSGIFSREKILVGLGKLKIVEVSLEAGHDNPQLIFESLNSTGLDLSNSDLVRNFILMALPYEVQRHYYEKYWVEIENNCAFNSEEFVRDYLIIKTKKIPSKNDVYKTFKDFALGNDQQKTKELLEDLLYHSRLYSYVWNTEHPSKAVSKAISSFRQIGAKAITPYLVSLLDDFDKNLLSEDVVVRSLAYIEAFIIRRSICELPSSSLVKTFSSLHREAKRISDNWQSEYVNHLMFVLARKANKGRYPKDEELDVAVSERDFYEFNHLIRNFIFDSLENKGKKEKTDVRDGIDKGELSIEHIMPQTLSKKWKEELGETAKAIHERYLNVLGNLTVTAFNSQISNKTFKEKRSMAFENSPYWLNKFVADQSAWSEVEIVERSKLLSKRLLTLWPDVDRSIEYQTDELEEHVLADPIDVKYTNPVSIQIKDKVFEAATYREIMAEFLKYVYAVDSTKLFGLKDLEKFSTCIVTVDPSELKSPYEIGDGLFTEGGFSATTHVKNIIRIAPHFGLDLEEIVITTTKERRPEIKMGKTA